MKKLIIASLFAASAVAMAEPVLEWSTATVVEGVTYVYVINPKSARQIGTGVDAFWTAQLAVLVNGKVVARANVVADGCDQNPAAGTTAVVDDNGKLLEGTAAAEWSAEHVKSGNAKVNEIIASYTCLASSMNAQEDTKPPATAKKSKYTQEI